MGFGDSLGDARRTTAGELVPKSTQTVRGSVVLYSMGPTYFLVEFRFDRRRGAATVVVAEPRVVVAPVEFLLRFFECHEVKSTRVVRRSPCQQLNLACRG